MKRSTICLALSATLLATGSASASAATRAVDDDGRATPSNCNATAPASPTIQGAVTAASAGDTIVVCPGTYVEQVIVPADKNRLTLVSSVRRQAIIKAPPLSTATYNRTQPDLVVVDGAENVNILRFTITGPLAEDQFCSEKLVTAVRIQKDGSGNLVDNRITKARSTALLGCQNGFAVQIGRNFENDGGTGRLFGNEIDDYQKGGIYVDGPRSELVAGGNVVRGSDTGVGPLSSLAAQNGIQISRGSDASVFGNRVLDNAFVGLPNVPGSEAGQASGIIVFNDGDGAAGRVSLDSNLVQANDTNIALYNRDEARIEDNRLLDAVVYDGLYLDADSERNRLEDNFARGNQEHDCHDDSKGSGTAGTANFWKGNDGVTETPEGICTDDRNGDDDDEDDDDDRRRRGR